LNTPALPRSTNGQFRQCLHELSLPGNWTKPMHSSLLCRVARADLDAWMNLLVFIVPMMSRYGGTSEISSDRATGSASGEP
jgi:hypothetical protein